MALSSFEDAAAPPSLRELEAALGASAGLWRDLVHFVAERFPPASEEWAFAGAKFGWSLRLVQGKRRVLYLIPQQGGFLAGVVLGEKAVGAARESGLADGVLEALEAAPKYAEGRGLRLPVRTARDVAAVRTLVGLKMGAPEGGSAGRRRKPAGAR